MNCGVPPCQAEPDHPVPRTRNRPDTHQGTALDGADRRRDCCYGRHRHLAGGSAHQYTLRLTPITPLTAKACVSETRRYGYNAPAGAIICSPATKQAFASSV
jgi:hypothetical protein